MSKFLCRFKTSSGNMLIAYSDYYYYPHDGWSQYDKLCLNLCHSCKRYVVNADLYGNPESKSEIKCQKCGYKNSTNDYSKLYRISA